MLGLSLINCYTLEHKWLINKMLNKKKKNSSILVLLILLNMLPVHADI